MNEIKYIGFYNLPNSKIKRAAALSATNKMDYICDSINIAGYKVHLVSPSWLIDSSSDSKFHKKSEIKIKEHKKLTLAPSFETSNKYTGYIKISYSLIWLFFWLIFNVKKNEKILVYHSPWIVLPVLGAKKIKGFNLILEVEEIYGDVSSLTPYFDKLEEKIFKNANSFLFSTELLTDKIKSDKNFIVIYGSYQVYDDLDFPPLDDKIHLVYAGIIDSHKAGAFNAIESALFLNEKYIIHIIGFGEVDKLKLRIEEINKSSKCKVVFDGSKQGDEYLKYCQKCHIGMSTQNMAGTYLETSFPSKILSYLGMGLRVISCEIKCVTFSKINPIMNYYNEDNPKSIAKSILNINVDEYYDSKKMIVDLDLEFIRELKKMIM